MTVLIPTRRAHEAANEQAALAEAIARHRFPPHVQKRLIILRGRSGRGFSLRFIAELCYADGEIAAVFFWVIRFDFFTKVTCAARADFGASLIPRI